MHNLFLLIFSKWAGFFIFPLIFFLTASCILHIFHKDTERFPCEEQKGAFMKHPSFDNEYVEAVQKEHPDWVFTFTPEPQKTPFHMDAYRIINLKPRILNSNFSSDLFTGDMGGYVEHPEFLDRTQDLWLTKNALLRGKVTVQGSAYLMGAVVCGSDLRGTVLVGQPSIDRKRCLEDQVYVGRCGVSIQIENSVLDSGQDVISVMDGARILRGKIYGDTAIIDFSRVTDSEIHDSYLCDYAWVHHSVLKNSTVCESAAVLASRMDEVTVREEAVVEQTSIRHRNLDGRKFAFKGQIVPMFPLYLSAKDRISRDPENLFFQA